MKGVDLKELLLSEQDDGSNDYKSGWNDAIFYVFEKYKVECRNREPIYIGFEVDINEDEIAEAILEKQNAR